MDSINVPEDAVDDEGVMVAARSRGTNLPLTRGWSLQVLLGARMFVSIGDDGFDKCWRHVYNTG